MKILKSLSALFMAAAILASSVQFLTPAVFAAGAPPVPQNVKAVSASYNSIKISWPKVSGATGYKVCRYNSSTKVYGSIKVTTALSYTDTSLTTGKTYSYKLSAYTTANGKNYYSSLSAPVSAKPVPSVTGSLTAAKLSNSSIKLSWSAVAGATGYAVYKYNSATKGYSLIKTTTLIYYTVTGLVNGNTYYYQVKAYRAVNGSNIYGSPKTVMYSNFYVDKIDWSGYDKLISQIYSSTNYVSREALMHQAEDKLMGTGAVCPLYYYNDTYMMKTGVKGFYATTTGYKYFMYTTYGTKTTLKINLASEPARLDPALNSSVDGAVLAANSFAGLYTYTGDNKPAPALAKSYTVSADGKTYVFTMKDNLKWSDGSALTAKDLEYSWKRAASTATAADYSYMFNGIAGFPDNLNVKASADGMTLTVVLSAPCAYFLDLCAFPAFYAVKKSCVEAAQSPYDPGAWAEEAGFVTSGAYTLQTWAHDSKMVYVKNPYYWDAANVTMEKLEFMLSADDTAIYNSYKAGNLDFIDTIPVDQNVSFSPEFHKVDQLGTYYICFNVKSTMFKGKTAAQANAMRRGLGLLIDRKKIVDTVGLTGQKTANAFIPENMFDGHGGIFKFNDTAYTYPVKSSAGYFELGTTLAQYNTNIQQGIALLKSAGFQFDANNKLKSSTPLAFSYLINQNTGHQQIAQSIQQDFARFGIKMTIKAVDWNTMINDRKLGKFDACRNGWIADYNDPVNMLEMFASYSGNNDCQLGK